eukprot:EG_transcript_17949
MRLALFLIVVCCTWHWTDGVPWNATECLPRKRRVPDPEFGERKLALSSRTFETPNPCQQPGPVNFNGQLLQDAITLKLLNNKTHGYFLDLAASDPVYLSNTYTLERWFGWDGICIEGNPHFIESLKQGRNCTVVHAAVSSAHNETVRFRVDNGVLGGIISHHTDNRPGAHEKGWAIMELQTRKLEDILAEHCAPEVIDFFSLDVEGSEWEVLRNFPFDAYQFRVLTIERPPVALTQLLRRHGYHRLGLVGCFGEQVWVHKQLATERHGGLKHMVLELWHKFGLLPMDETRDISISRLGQDQTKETWAVHIQL